MDYIGRSSRRS